MPERSVHPAVAADYQHYVRLFAELGVDDPILEPSRWEATHLPDTTFVREDGEVVAWGYAQALESVGYVRHVAVDPARRGAGVGGVLMEAIAARLVEAGCSRWCLNVKADNQPALRLYHRLGMQTAYTSTFLRFDWALVARLPRADRATIPRPVEPGDDAAIEAAFSLPSRQIAHTRSLGRVLCWLDAGTPVGFASFDPHFPGAFPFRVTEVGLAAALLEALRPHARDELPFMQVVVEGHEELTGELVRAGAERRLEFLHLAGDLPPSGPG